MKPDFQREFTDDTAVISIILDQTTPAVHLVNIDQYIKGGGGTVLKPWKCYRQFLVAKYEARARVVHTVRLLDGVVQAKIKFRTSKPPGTPGTPGTSGNSKG